MQKRAILITGVIALSLILALAIVLVFLAKKEDLNYNLTQELINSASWQDLTLKSINNGEFKSSLTSQLAKSIAGDLVKSNPNGPQNIAGISDALTFNSPDKLIYQSGSQYLTDLASQEAKVIKNIISSQNNSIAAQKNYFNQVFSISAKYFSNFSQGSDLAVQNVFQNQDSTLLSQFKDAYSNVFNETAQLVVPQSLYSFHKDYLVNLFRIKTSLADIANYNNDPLKATLALELYDETMPKLMSILADYLNYFNKIKV